MSNPYMSNYEELRTFAKKCKMVENDAMNATHKVRKENYIKKDNGNLTLNPELYDTSTGKPVTKGTLKVNESSIDTGAQAAFTELNTEDVSVVKEATQTKKVSKIHKEITEWIDETIFKEGKYHNMDKASVLSMAKFMFDLGVKYNKTGKLNLPKSLK